MNRGWTIFGLFVIALMLLVPPKEVRVHDTYSAAADDVIQLEGVPDRDYAGEHGATRVIYRPVGMDLPGELRPGEIVQGGTLATQRLLLQIVVAVVVIGGLALLGPTEWETAASKEKRTR